jgi:formylglycine-generating enzyme required for sulfatase activity
MNLRVFAAGIACGVSIAAHAAAPDVNSAGMKLIRVNEGEFLMGLANSGKLMRAHPFSAFLPAGEDVAHRVRLTRPFFIASHETTVGQFRAFVQATGYKTDAERAGGAFVLDAKAKSHADRFARKADADWRNPGFPQTDAHPVTCVSFNDAVAFCQWLGKKEGGIYRLPTEAEWEYACRAGTTTIYSCGDEQDAVYSNANVADETLENLFPGEVSRQRTDWKGRTDGFAFTAPAGAFKPNAWGLHDMHGNVWEWCSDRFHDRYYRELVDKVPPPLGKPRPRPEEVLITDPQGPDTTTQHKYGDWRVMRGGSWYVAPVYCRSDFRGYGEAADAFSYTGFRVVKEIPAEKR